MNVKTAGSPLQSNKAINKLRVVSWDAYSSFSVSILSYVVSQICTAAPVLIALIFLSWESIETQYLDLPWVNLVLTGFGALGMLFTLYAFFKLKHISYRELGFSKSIKLRHVWLVVGMYIAYLITSILFTTLVSAIIPGYDPAQDQEIGFSNVYGWQLALAFIGLVVIPPIAEELLFRGFLYQGLRDHWNSRTVIIWLLSIAILVGIFVNVVAGIVITLITVISIQLSNNHKKLAAAIASGLLFGLVHLQWNISLDTFIFSFALVYVFHKTQSIWASIALHALKNGIAFVGIFLLT